MTLPAPYYNHAGITIYHADCLDILPELGEVDAVIADPPYGIKNNIDSSRFSGGHRRGQLKKGRGGRFSGIITGDNISFNPQPFLKFKKIILWGSNHYATQLPIGTTLVWIKRLDHAFGTFLSDAEIGWMNSGCGVYCYRDLSMTAESNQRLHPNQKPISLMKWCIEKAGGNGIILDPFMGSGTTLVAAKELGRRAIGIEICEEYCEIAVKRLRQEVLPIQQKQKEKDPKPERLL